MRVKPLWTARKELVRPVPQKVKSAAEKNGGPLCIHKMGDVNTACHSGLASQSGLWETVVL